MTPEPNSRGPHVLHYDLIIRSGLVVDGTSGEPFAGDVAVDGGVTTVVMGNCGVGFAPVRAQNRDRLVELMEGVEDIPGSALREGPGARHSSLPRA
jgi:N-acyl-D-aspartate/D-glutamate deacylase